MRATTRLRRTNFSIWDTSGIEQAAALKVISRGISNYNLIMMYTNRSAVSGGYSLTLLREAQYCTHLQLIKFAHILQSFPGISSYNDE